MIRYLTIAARAVAAALAVSAAYEAVREANRAVRLVAGDVLELQAERRAALERARAAHPANGADRVPYQPAPTGPDLSHIVDAYADVLEQLDDVDLDDPAARNARLEARRAAEQHHTNGYLAHLVDKARAGELNDDEQHVDVGALALADTDKRHRKAAAGVLERAGLEQPESD